MADFLKMVHEKTLSFKEYQLTAIWEGCNLFDKKNIDLDIDFMSEILKAVIKLEEGKLRINYDFLFLPLMMVGCFGFMAYQPL